MKSSVILTSLIFAVWVGMFQAEHCYAESESVYNLVTESSSKGGPPKQFVYTLKLSGSVDFDTAKGHASVLDSEFGLLLPLGQGKFSLSPGLILGGSRNDDGTAWKTGAQIRLDGPALNGRWSPFGKVALLYQHSGDGNSSESIVGQSSLGLSVLFALHGCSKSALEMELGYYRASKAIYQEYDEFSKNDLKFQVGFKLFIY